MGDTSMVRTTAFVTAWILAIWLGLVSVQAQSVVSPNRQVLLVSGVAEPLVEKNTDYSQGNRNRGAQQAPNTNSNPPADTVPRVDASKPPHQDRSADQGGGDSKGKDPNHNAKPVSWSAFVEKIFEDPVSFFTVWVAIFTGVLAWSTIGLWRETKKLAMQAIQSGYDNKNSIEIAKIGVSAVVDFINYTTHIESNGNTVVQYTFHANLENSGNTRASVISVKSGIVLIETLADIPEIPLRETLGKFDLGKGSKVMSGGDFITAQGALKVWKGTHKCIISHEVNYKDVFGEDHKTSRMVRIYFRGDPSISGNTGNNDFVIFEIAR
ncbi:hypothetical protein [Methylobacterium indicum]|uniref:hypothetical protein n=1 Tax=Methylobacterium indicum TaxID=1775910 RepID=UPI002435A716|nr:hypothetical protein [Methylobacterium indicum]